jgi:signal transduction histidine kinase
MMRGVPSESLREVLVMSSTYLQVFGWLMLSAACLVLVGRNRWLARKRRSLEAFSQKLLASQEKERAQIAAELHSSLGQNLLIIKNRAQLGLAPGSTVEQMREQLAAVCGTCSEAIEQARGIAHNLGPQHLDQLGLTEALDAMIDRVAASTSLRFERRLEPVDDLFELEAATNLYRIAQEALNNVMKHAAASVVRVELIRDLKGVQLLIQDNGRGFEGAKANGGSGNSGLGLAEIRQRAGILGGTFQLESDTGGVGTCLRIIIPLNESLSYGGQTRLAPPPRARQRTEQATEDYFAPVAESDALGSLRCLISRFFS